MRIGAGNAGRRRKGRIMNVRKMVGMAVAVSCMALGAVFASAGSALGATAHMYPISSNLTPIDADNAILTPDGNPVLFEVLVDSASAAEVFGFQWEVGIDLEGHGLVFNASSSQSLSRAMATGNSDYMLYGDSDGFYAFTSVKGLVGSDLDPSPDSGHVPVGKLLGVVALDMTDVGAVTTQLGNGGYTLSDPYSYLLLGDYFSTESLDIPAFNLIPEPGMMALLMVGGLAILRRRRNR